MKGTPMKKLLALAILLSIGLIAPATFAEVAPVGTVDLGLLPLLGFETPVWMVVDTALRPKPSPGPAWCQNRNSQYCSYSWDQANYCCRGTVIIPNSYCPDICL